MITTKRWLFAYAMTLLATLLYQFAVGLPMRLFHAMHQDLLRDTPMLRVVLSTCVSVGFVLVFYGLFVRGRASCLSSGIVFGVMLGLIAGWMPQVFAKLILANFPFYLVWAAAGFGQFVLMGAVLGLVYRE